MGWGEKGQVEFYTALYILFLFFFFFTLDVIIPVFSSFPLCTPQSESVVCQTITCEHERNCAKTGSRSHSNLFDKKKKKKRREAGGGWWRGKWGTVRAEAA